jgi:hypothetical protein
MFKLPNSLFPVARDRVRKSKDEQRILLRLRDSKVFFAPVDLGLGGDGELRNLSGRTDDVGE